MKLDNFSNYDINVEDGTIYSYFSNNTIGHLNDDGYYCTTIYDDNGKSHTVRHHRFIWEAIHGNIPNGYDIHHIDKDRTNNAISNLELVESSTHKRIHFTRENNPMYGKPNPKASEIGKKRSKQVGCFSLDGELIKIYNSLREAESDGFNSGNISKCCNNIYKTYKNYVWKFMGC